MAVKRERRTTHLDLPDVEAFTGARWFAGKGRAVVRLEPVREIVPGGASGAALVLVEVEYDGGDHETYALPLRDGSECGGDDPLWRALARAAGVEDAPATSRFLAQDLSNTVVSLGDRLVLKLFRRLETGPHPEVELLAAVGGFPHMPAFAGAVVNEGVTVALVEEYVAGVPIGWEGLIARLAEGHEALEDARELGHVTALLHRRLALALGARVADRADVARERASADAAMAELEPSVAIGSSLEPLALLSGARVQRVHGDLHVGQVLRAERGLVVIDFEGDPSLPLTERSRERSSLVDVASLLLSLDHVACAAARRTAALDWRAWSFQARATCLSAYETQAGPVDRELLRALEIAKELRELVYATRWLPEWLYAPSAVLPTLLEDVA